MIKIAQENYSHLRNLKLADSNPENLPMDIQSWTKYMVQNIWLNIRKKTNTTSELA